MPPTWATFTLHLANPRCRCHVGSGIGFCDNQNGFMNSMLVALPQSSIDPLQPVQTAAARLITGTGTRKDITPAFRSLHWLPVKFDITFKLWIRMHMVHIDRDRAYLCDMVPATAVLFCRGRIDLPTLLGMNFHNWNARSTRNASDHPFGLQELTSACTFKRQLNTRLFTMMYTTCRILLCWNPAGHFRCRRRVKWRKCNVMWYMYHLFCSPCATTWYCICWRVHCIDSIQRKLRQKPRAL